jgi:hypothetical protein
MAASALVWGAAVCEARCTLVAKKNRKTASVTPPPEVVVFIGDLRDGGAKMTILGASIVTPVRFDVAEVRMRSQNTLRRVMLDRAGRAKH